MADFFSDIALEQSAALTTSGVRLSSGSKDGEIKIWTYTQIAQGADPTSVGLFVLRANEVLDCHHASIAFSALGASRLIDIGHDAFTDANGVVTAADPNAIADGIVATNAGRSVFVDAPTSSVDSFGPFPVDVVITAEVNGGTFDAANTLNGSAHVGLP